MTGEVTLSGKVLPVGAVKEKVIAASRAGIREIILPRLNEKDTVDIPDLIKRQIRFRFIERVDEGISLALLARERSTKARRKRRHAA
jgi:ATP-dependent Lon protease